MTTQIVDIDGYAYAGTLGAKLRDPDDISDIIATADTVVLSSDVTSRIICTFSEVTVIPSGVYLVELIVNGVSYILYVALTGVDGESVLARSERAVVLDAIAIRAAVGLSDANIDEQFSDLMTAVSDIQVDVDANTGYLTSILAKLGAWSGTGVNTVLGAFKALLSKTATMPSDIGGTGDPTTDSVEAIRDRGDAAWATGGGGGSGTESDLMVSTTIATLSSQTVFTLTAGSPDNDAYNDCMAIITDQTTAEQKAKVFVSDYVGSTKTLTLSAAGVFSVAVGDSISIIAVGSTATTAVDLRGPGDEFVSFDFVDDGNAVADVSVWITLDSSGLNVVAGTLTSNGAGRVTFLLTAGATYYLWAEKVGKVSIQGRGFVAVAD